MNAERKKEKPRLPCAVPRPADFFAMLPLADKERVAAALAFCWLEMGQETAGLRCAGAKNCRALPTVVLRLHANVLCAACFAGRAKLV